MTAATGISSATGQAYVEIMWESHFAFVEVDERVEMGRECVKTRAAPSSHQNVTLVEKALGTRKGSCIIPFGPIAPGRYSA